MHAYNGRLHRMKYFLILDIRTIKLIKNTGKKCIVSSDIYRQKIFIQRKVYFIDPKRSRDNNTINTPSEKDLIPFDIDLRSLITFN